MKFKGEAKYFKLGLTLLCVVVASTVFQVIFSNLPGFFNVIKSFIKIIAPILYGVLFAYLLNPTMVFVERRLYRLFSRKPAQDFREQHVVDKKRKQLAHIIGIVASFFVFSVIVYLMIVLVMPTIIDNVKTLANPDKIMEYYNLISEWIAMLSADAPEIGEWVMARFDDIYLYAENWLLSVDISQALVAVTTQVYGAVKSVLDAVIGIVVAIYMLLSKEKFIAQGKKLLIAIFPDERCDRILEIGRRTNKIFGGFVMGKIIDSLIIGVMCYIGMLILRLPYPMLIAVIIGVTNVIPFFGPFIGAIPSAFLILLINPLQCVWFVIFVICLQQFDGNILGPYILGDSVGLSSFWILISITLFSGLFGFAGMLLGVPIFAILYMLVSDFVTRSLTRKGKPLETEIYIKVQTMEDIELARRMHEFAVEHAAFHDDDPEAEVYDMEDDLEIEDLTEDEYNAIDADEVEDMNAVEK